MKAAVPLHHHDIWVFISARRNKQEVLYVYCTVILWRPPSFECSETLPSRHSDLILNSYVGEFKNTYVRLLRV